MPLFQKRTQKHAIQINLKINWVSRSKIVKHPTEVCTFINVVEMQLIARRRGDFTSLSLNLLPALR